jgi:hypothetical protein
LLLTEAERIRDSYAIMVSVGDFFGTLFRDFGLRPGESKNIGGYIVTAPEAARFEPFIVPVDGIEAAA